MCGHVRTRMTLDPNKPARHDMTQFSKVMYSFPDTPGIQYRFSRTKAHNPCVDTIHRDAWPMCDDTTAIGTCSPCVMMTVTGMHGLSPPHHSPYSNTQPCHDQAPHVSDE